MSYDLVVFEKTKAPSTEKEFMAWYENQTEWSEEHDYQTIGIASPALQSFFMEIKEMFPPLNGEYAVSDDALEDEAIEKYVTDYCIGRDVIDMAFGWSVSKEAYQKVKDVAAKCGVGFFDPSMTGEILLPDGTAIQDTAKEVSGNSQSEKSGGLFSRLFKKR